MSQTAIHTRFLRLLLALVSTMGIPCLAQADPAPLAPGLRFDLPSSLNIRREQFDQLNDASILVGYVQGEPGYFISARKNGRDLSALRHWRLLDTELKKQADLRTIEKLAMGDYRTLAGHKVGYRLYRYRREQVEQRQLFHLLITDDSSYWITATSVDSVNLLVAFPLIKAIVRRAQTDPPLE